MSDAEIIESVQQFSVIWDKRNPNHRNKLIVRNAWASIGLALNISADVCEQRFLNIRNRYCKERRILSNSTRSGAGAYEVQWPHFKACSFLDKVIVSRTRSNCANPAESMQCETPQSSVNDEDSCTEDSSSVCVSKLLENQSIDDGDLTLNDVFNHRNIFNTPSCSRSSNESSFKPPAKGGKEKGGRILSEINSLKKRISGAFDTFTELCTEAAQPEKVSSELKDEDYAFGRTVALSLKYIHSKKKRFSIQSDIMRIIADAADED